MEQVSQKQVFYMLTPVGIIEKAKKTVSYVKAHYRAIYDTKEKIKSVLVELALEYDDIFVFSKDIYRFFWLQCIVVVIFKITDSC